MEKKCEHCGLLTETVECKYGENCEYVNRPCNLCLGCQHAVEIGKIECPPKYKSGWG